MLNPKKSTLHFHNNIFYFSKRVSFHTPPSCGVRPARCAPQYLNMDLFMYVFSDSSQRKLETCCPDLIRLFNEVIKHRDCKIIYGRREKEEQDRLFKEGKSRLNYPHSSHNRYPSRGIDVAPYPIDWKDAGRFYMFVGYVQAVAEKLNIPIRCGADWDGDTRTTDQKFNDLVHFEVRE